MENKTKIIIGSGKVANIIKNAGDMVLPSSFIDVRNISSVSAALSKYPSNTVIVNTAAKINLEWCEMHRGESKDVNVNGAANVAKVCAEHGLHLVHISSGCIFDGMETEYEYDETDVPSPASWYAHCKAEADKKILSIEYDKITIVRPRQLISPVPNPTNMLTKFLSIKNGNFIDSKNSVTCIEDMKEAIDHLIDKRAYGVYNVANIGTISPYLIADLLRQYVDNSMQVNKVSYEDYVKTLNVKRVNTILKLDKLISTGYVPRSASDAVKWCILNYGKISS